MANPDPETRVTAARDAALGRLSAGSILLGVGLGGFFDGIVLHQILQWHHLLTSAGFPPDSVGNLQVNTLWDGLFHAATYVFTLVGLFLVWSGASRSPVRWPSSLLLGGLLLGWGLFNLLEGLVNHHLLGLHHVNETAPLEQWLAWDLGFVAWGLIMLVGGWLLVQRERDAVSAQGGGSE